MMINGLKPGQEYYDLTPEEREEFREISQKADAKYFELSRNPELAKQLLDAFRDEMAEMEKAVEFKP